MFFISASLMFSPSVFPVTVRQLVSIMFGVLQVSFNIALIPPAASTSSMCQSLDGETLQMLGHLAEMALILSRSYLMPASLAMASVCRTVFVEPPIAISRASALSSDFSLMISSGLMSFSINVSICLPACW